MTIGPITIMWTKKLDAYREVVKTAWPVHQFIWFFGENNTFPENMQELPELDAALSDALSRTPPGDAPQ